VTLKRGGKDDPISHTLSNVSLDFKPRYDAFLTCGGIRRNVRKSSSTGRSSWQTVDHVAALKHHRKAEIDRDRWIDAICIDQTDNDERSKHSSKFS